jgi:hypothetical protein
MTEMEEQKHIIQYIKAKSPSFFFEKGEKYNSVAIPWLMKPRTVGDKNAALCVYKLTP